MIGDQQRGVVARNILSLRSFREENFPRALFDEYAWNMLLLLFVGLANNEVVTERSLIKQADVTHNAGRRWIAHLVSDGQVVARNDGDDVILTEAATDALRAFLDRVSVLPWSSEPPQAVPARDQGA
jgi:hypothetical protein